MRLENYLEDATVTADIAQNVTKGNVDVIGGGMDIIKSATGDDNLRVDLINTLDNKYQVIVYTFKDNKWTINKTYKFDEKESALDKYNKIVKEF